MKRNTNQSQIVGLDVGTSKICTVVGEDKGDGLIEVTGIGKHPSHGLKKGMIIDIESTVQSIQRSLDEAQLMSGCTIQSVYIGIAGSHINGLNSDGAVAINNQEISQADVDHVLSTARAVAIPSGQQVLHTLVQDYVIDGYSGIKSPLGMSGVRLETQVHMVTGAEGAVRNIVNCARHCGLVVADVVLEQLASSEAVLTADEKNLGVMLIDIGGGTTDLAIFHNSAIRHTANIPIAGDQVTKDISIALRTPIREAEKIKLRYACALAKLASTEEIIEVPSIGDRPPRQLARQVLAEVVEPRYEELFKLIQGELKKSGFEQMIPAGAVLTGGSVKIEGMRELAEEILQVPIRIGMPANNIGLKNVTRDPIYATAIGLLYFGQKQRRRENGQRMSTPSLMKRITGWFHGHF